MQLYSFERKGFQCIYFVWLTLLLQRNAKLRRLVKCQTFPGNAQDSICEFCFDLYLFGGGEVLCF